MPRPQAQRAGPDEARAYLAKAHEFLHAARSSLELSNHTAAVGNAVHAGIAGDALSAARTGTVWRGEHARAAGHLEDAGDEGRQAARHLRRLLPMKTRAEYEPTRCDRRTQRPPSRPLTDSSDSLRRPSPP
ncbi:MAG: hypothetical protein ACYDEN_09260 [Acidimicrobiales bacterium]